MPSINLRLSENQHTELERWATDGHRSLQKEIIFRLFSNEARLMGSDEAMITSSAGFITPQGREDAARVMVGKEFPKMEPAQRGVTSGGCPMSPPSGTKCKVCGKVHPL